MIIIKKNRIYTRISERIKRIPLLFVLFVFIFTFISFKAAFPEDAINLSAGHLEYISETSTYIAKDSVTLRYEDAVLSADNIHLNEKTLDAVITGNVTYEDPDAFIKADKIELNLKTKLGTIYNSYVFYKKHNFHLKGGDIKKIGDKTFFLDKANFTTCDADPPPWQVSAKDITATQHKSIRAWNNVFKIKHTPILYSPYFWAPLKKDRQTGFLFPSFGYSSRRGHYFKQGFFWAMKDDKDATFYLDYYSEKGFAQGLDYRFVNTPESNGELWIYHVRDNDPLRDLIELKSYVNNKPSRDLSAYLKLHVVSNFDYYEVMESTSSQRFGLSSWETDPFGFASEERLQKYVESDVHVSRSFHGGRAYFLGQGRQSLEGSSEGIPQSFPEMAFILNTNSRKYVSYNLAVAGTNFWREDGQRGQRVDINPNIYLSFGRLIFLTQRVGLRETAYLLNKPSASKNRLLADFGTSVSTKLYKKYDTFIHLIEPSLEYTFIPPIEVDDIPFFDSVDTIAHTSSIAYALTNRISGLNSRNIEARFRLSQSYNFLDVDKEFSPLLAEATLTTADLELSMNASYDTHDGNVEETIASLMLKGEKGYLGLGKNFRRVTLLDQYTFEFGMYRPINMFGKSLPIDFQGKLWYDVKGGGVQELHASSTYQHQCWGFSLTYNRRPEEYQIIFAIELTGLGSLKLGSI